MSKGERGPIKGVSLITSQIFPIFLTAQKLIVIEFYLTPSALPTS